MPWNQNLAALQGASADDDMARVVSVRRVVPPHEDLNRSAGPGCENKNPWDAQKVVWCLDADRELDCGPDHVKTVSRAGLSAQVRSPVCALVTDENVDRLIGSLENPEEWHRPQAVG